jgi:hypothetical protein
VRLVIGVPSFGAPDPLFAIDSLAPLMYHIGRRHPEIEETLLIRDTRTYRHHARQAIVESALSVNADYLLMLDDDQTFTGNAFDMLWEHNHHRVVSGLYFTRTIPPVPCIFNLGAQGSDPILEYPKDTLMEVEIVGFGFILFQMQIFNQVPGPYFQVGNWLGEDVAFSVKLQAAGIKQWVHTGCRIGHIMEQRQVITEATYDQYKGSVLSEHGARSGSVLWTQEPRDGKGGRGPDQTSRAEVLSRISGAGTPEVRALPDGA